MRQIICPVCGQEPNAHPSKYQIIHCENCGVQWTYIPEDVDPNELYSDEVYAVVDNRKSIFERIIFKEAEKILRRARALIGQGRKILDFGSGKGQFLYIAKNLGWSGTGIETAEERANFARNKYGVHVVSELYESGRIEGGSYDLITLNHVLEHLPRPIQLLDELLTHNLADNGSVYIEVPRSNSWQSKLAGKSWMHWDLPKHLTHWSEKSLENQLYTIGLKKIKDRRFSVHLGLMGMLQALLSLVGYRKNLILNLKRKKDPLLYMLILVFSPLALILEGTACLFNRGGILGVYFSKNGQQ